MQRNRHDAWLTGVCGGIGAHVGVGAGWVRLAFIVSSLSGGFGVLLYALAWVVMPLEPTPDASDESQVTGLRGLILGVLVAGAGTAALLLGGGTTARINGIVVLAPAVVAVGGVVIRRGSLKLKATLLLVGITLSVMLGWMNYHPRLGDQTIRPELYELGPGFTNALGTLTIDLSSYDASSGHLTVNAMTLGGDVVLRVPENASVINVDEDVAFGTTQHNEAVGTTGRSLLSIRLHVTGILGSVRVEQAR